MSVQTSNQELTDQFIQFFRTYYRDAIGELAQRYPNERRSLVIDYDDLYQFSADLAEDYKENPDQLREYAEEALTLYDLPADVKLSNAHVRVENLPPADTVGIRNIRVHDDHIGHLIAVKGIIRKATDVRPKITDAAFECQRCGTMNYIPQQDGEFQEPHECQGCERQGPFSINFDQSDFVDAQKLRVQESPEGLRGGETPQSIDVNIEDDITGDVSPGDNVTVVGVLHIDQAGDDSTMFETYLDGVSVKIENEEYENIDMTDAELAEIEELSNDPDIYDMMVDSIAPAIYGFEKEKLAMVLQLFGGVRKNLPSGSKIRGDLHILLIGDPGTGKSQLISFVEKVAPRSVYTSGKGSSAAGLTAAAVRDDFSEGDQWTLSAGAVVLADQGVAAVDEIDKMESDDRSSLHEALEQQTVSIAKAGINATLKARCSLLAAANPKYGRFDRYEPVPSQIELEPALISRFDLIFTVTDNPDPEQDSNLAQHILKTNYAGELHTHRTEVATGQNQVEQQQVDDATEDVEPEIDAELLRKYVAYAKRECFPTMTTEARSTIEEFYVDLRSKGGDEEDAIPVTARKLEAIIRLAEASARVRFGDTVSVEDANRAISIAKSSLEDVGRDPETGEFDADVIETGTTKTQRDRIKSLKGLISEIESEYDDGAPHEEVVDRADEVGLDESKIDDEIEKLRRKGELYEPAQDHYRTT